MCVIYLNLVLFMNSLCIGIIHVYSKLLPLCSQINVGKIFDKNVLFTATLRNQSLEMSYIFHYLTPKLLSHRSQIDPQRKSIYLYLTSNLLSYCSQNIRQIWFEYIGPNLFIKWQCIPSKLLPHCSQIYVKQINGNSFLSTATLLTEAIWTEIKNVIRIP